MPPPPVWSRIFIWTLGTGTVTLFLWSVFTKIEETIILTGEISTLTPEIKVSAMDPGKIVSVKVNPNQYVNKGQVLIVYSDDETSARLVSTKERLSLAKDQRMNIYKSYDLKIILPSPENSRRIAINQYLSTHGIKPKSILEMDGMIGTLEMVAYSDWCSILPAALCDLDIDGNSRTLSPLDSPS